MLQVSLMYPFPPVTNDDEQGDERNGKDDDE